MAPTPIKAVVSHSGDNLDDKFDDSRIKEGNRKWLKAKIEILKRMVPVMVDSAEKITEKEASKLRRSALKKMEKSLDENIDRLERLKRLGHPIREVEITSGRKKH